MRVKCVCIMQLLMFPSCVTAGSAVIARLVLRKFQSRRRFVALFHMLHLS